MLIQFCICLISKYNNLRILVLILFLFILWDTYGIIMIPAEVWYCKHQGKFDRQTTDELT